MSEIMKTATENMKIAQHKQKEQADKNRRKTPNWNVGDSVFVSTEELQGIQQTEGEVHWTLQDY